MYFFQKRKIYGIGKIVNILNDCKYFNYPEASIPEEQKLDIFKKGIDMDDALNSNQHSFGIHMIKK